MENFNELYKTKASFKENVEKLEESDYYRLPKKNLGLSIMIGELQNTLSKDNFKLTELKSNKMSGNPQIIYSIFLLKNIEGKEVKVAITHDQEAIMIVNFIAPKLSNVTYHILWNSTVLARDLAYALISEFKYYFNSGLYI